MSAVMRTGEFSVARARGLRSREGYNQSQRAMMFRCISDVPE